MPTALHNPRGWFERHVGSMRSDNWGWVEQVIHKWRGELPERELNKRFQKCFPPRTEKPISDSDIDALLERVLNPSPLTNPKWAASPQLAGYLFQAQLVLILRHLNYEAHCEHPVGPDGGIDMDARTPEGQAVVIQVKKYAKPVGKEQVENFYHAIANTAFGVVMPELWFVAPELTDGARMFCREQGIIQKEVPELRRMLAQALKNGLDVDALLTIDPTRVA